MKNKKILTGVFAGIILLAIAGFVLHLNKKNAATNEAETIRIVYPISRGMGDKDISSLVEWFNEKYPDATLEMVSANVTTISDTVKSDLKNKNDIDIFVTTEYDAFFQDGLLADITDMEATTKFRKSVMRELERDGKIYALPIGGGNLIALHYNMDLFEKYGIEAPKSSENFSQLVARISDVVSDKKLDIDVLGASMLYPSQVADIYNSICADSTQKSDYLKWIADYDEGNKTFEDEIFKQYLQVLGKSMEKGKEWFSSDSLVRSQSSSIESFLKGDSFLYVGDVKRCYDTIQDNNNFSSDNIGVVGIPAGIDGVSYVSYMDELYIGVNNEYKDFSDNKKQMIEDILNYIVEGTDTTKNIFTFTGAYSSVYLEGQAVETIDNPYFEQINKCLENNYVEQEVCNTPFSHIFGRALLSWRKGKLSDFMKEGDSNIDKVILILEEYRTNGNNVFEKSEEPIGISKSFMEYQSNIVRSQESEIGNQVADMARNYMNTDFALINAGGIRASIPEGNVSQQTINAVLPYSNYLVKIKVSGATLKKALVNAYNVGPLYKSGQFGAVSGLKVELETNSEGYLQYKQDMDRWLSQNKDANSMEINTASKAIAENICKNDSKKLNLSLISVKDSEGNEIDDNKMYTVATVDYLLKNQDGYSMLGILGGSEDADTTIEIYDRNSKRITGDKKQMEEAISTKCKTIGDSFIDWIKEGHELDAVIDNRITINNFIYIE